MKVLLAEDDLRLGKMLKNILSRQGINAKWVTDGNAAYSECYADSYDVLVLDWMMPGMDGIELCRLLREEEYQGKILMLTARDTLDDKVNGLNAGADDYLVKPFAVAELLARLTALTRRQGSYINENLEYKGYVLKSDLLRNAGKIIPRDVLLERVWGIESDITDNNLDVHIRALRRKLEQIHAGALIRTVRGVGYMAEA